MTGRHRHVRAAVEGSLAAGVMAIALAPLPARVDAQGLKEQIDAAVDRYVALGAAREFTRCKLQDALWGQYNVTVFITIGADDLPWLFTIRNGAFARELDPKPESVPNHFERDGRVQPPSAEEAFTRGIPFFIQSAAFDAPDVLQLKVVSNPAVQEDDAMAFAVIEVDSDAADLPTMAAAVASAPAVQTVNLKADALAHARAVRVAILRGSDRQAHVIGCVISNEIDVTQ